MNSEKDIDPSKVFKIPGTQIFYDVDALYFWIITKSKTYPHNRQDISDTDFNIICRMVLRTSENGELKQITLFRINDNYGAPLFVDGLVSYVGLIQEQNATQNATTVKIQTYGNGCIIKITEGWTVVDPLIMQTNGGVFNFTELIAVQRRKAICVR